MEAIWLSAGAFLLPQDIIASKPLCRSAFNVFCVFAVYDLRQLPLCLVLLASFSPLLALVLLLSPLPGLACGRPPSLPIPLHPPVVPRGGSGKRGGWSGGRDIGYTPHILQPTGETGRGKTGGMVREKGLKIFGKRFCEVFRFDLVGNLW